MATHPKEKKKTDEISFKFDSVNILNESNELSWQKVKQVWNILCK